MSVSLRGEVLGGHVDAQDDMDPDDDAEEQWHLLVEGDGGEVVNPDRPGDWVMPSGGRPDVGSWC